MRCTAFALAVLGSLLGSAGNAAPSLPSGFALVPGTFEAGRQPDGNSVVIDAPGGAIVVDTGRHRRHAQAVLDAARQTGKPVAAIVNTHWHLDHVSGNPVLKSAFPAASVYASGAIDEALTGFLARSAAEARKALASGKLDPVTVEEVEGDLATFEHGDRLRPDVRIEETGPLSLARRRMEIRLAADAATQGDVWLYDPATRVAIVGDLVTLPAPFLDTACPTGWLAALKAVAATPFTTLVPGHGPVMDRPMFDRYRAGFAALVDCATSTRPATACADAWSVAATQIDPTIDPARARRMAAYYVGDVLRAAGGPRYCRAGRGSGE